MSHRIVVKNACIRKPGFLYHIDSEGNLVESGATPAAAATIAEATHNSQNSFTDDKSKHVSSRTRSLSHNDIKVSKEQLDQLQKGIRTATLKNILKVYFMQLQLPQLSLAQVMKELKCSKRTAYDYIKTIQGLKGGS